jgi:N-acyl-D-aspartate/D-glutamate deacylase
VNGPLQPARQFSNTVNGANLEAGCNICGGQAQADIVVFDPQTVQDRASFRASTEASVGVRYLVVAGTIVVNDGHLVEGVAPGRAFVRNIDSRQQGR